MMKTLGVRIHGKDDLRLDEYELPPIQDDEILADVVSSSICMSEYKAAIQGGDHKRVPNNVAENPMLMGHEFCGNILEVGAKYKDKFQPGMKYGIQPALNYPGRELEAPGYSYPYTGGHARQIIIAHEVLEMDCLLTYKGPGYFPASLSEPVSCIVGAFNSQYHFKPGTYHHLMGIVEGGTMALLAGAGPMGLGAIDYTLHGPKKPRMLIVTDIDQARLDRAAEIFTVAEGKRCGIDLRYVNTGGGNAVQDLLDLTGGKGYDDVFVFAPVAPLIEQGSRLLGFNGCLNFFAGPARQDFFAPINFYEIHYSGHHVVGSSGGNTDDLRESLEMMAANKINPAVMVTHVGGLDSTAQTILTLPKIPGGKRLVYTPISMPMIALNDLDSIAEENPLYKELAQLVKKHKGLWSLEAEEYLLKNGKKISAPSQKA